MFLFKYKDAARQKIAHIPLEPASSTAFNRSIHATSGEATLGRDAMSRRLGQCLSLGQHAIGRS